MIFLSKSHVNWLKAIANVPIFLWLNSLFTMSTRQMMVILSNDGWFIDNLWIFIVKPFSPYFPGLSMNIYGSPIISGASKALWLVQGLGFETFHSAVPFFVLRGPKAALEAVVEAPRRNGRISYSAFVHVYVYIYIFMYIDIYIDM